MEIFIKLFWFRNEKLFIENQKGEGKLIKFPKNNQDFYDFH
jgi:hypothetical protein